MDGQAISFGPFRLLPAQRLLLEGDQPVRLGSRAFDILATLLERPGEVIGKDELVSRTWPKTFVEDANLKIQISALRRALGDGQGGRRYIATIPGRGYNFVAPVRFEKPSRASLPATIVSAAAHNLPLAATRMIGREEAVASLVSRLSRERLLTIVGAGGIGKTTVALAVAERMIADYEHGVWLADLSPLGDPRLVPSAVATVLGLEVRTENPLPGLVAGLRDKRMLLLDNCEHVIDAAASLVAAVLSGVPRVDILATSREPLGVEGEHEHRLGPLGSPPTPSGLTAAAAAAVGPAAAKTRMDAIVRLAALVATSLVDADVSEAKPRIRLLDTTRAYAIGKLDESAERDQIARRHAEYHRQIFERAEVESAARRTDEWLADYAREIDNLRSALDWAFSPGGEAAIGVAVTAAAVPLWMRLSLPEECRGRAERALGALGAGASREARHEMKLRAAVAESLMYSRGGAFPETGMAYTRALEIAESLEDAKYRLRALWGLWAHHTASGRHRVALGPAQRFHALAAEQPDPNDRLNGEGMIGVSQHYLGDLPGAKRTLEQMLAGYVTPDQTSHIIRFQTDQRMLISVFLARVLWLQGFPDQATRTAHSSVEDARAANHTISLCVALAYAACPLALLTGDLVAAEYYVTMLLDHSTSHGLAHLRAGGLSFQGMLLIQHGDVITGLRLLRASFDEFGAEGSAVSRLIAFQMAEALGHAGQHAEGLAATEEAIARSESTEEHWAMAELLRVKGELLLMQGAPGA